MVQSTMVRSGLFQPVARQKLYHDVVSQLLGHIRGGRFAPAPISHPSASSCSCSASAG